MENSQKPVSDLSLPLSTKRSLPIALLRAREALMSHYRPMLAQFDITEQQWRVLRVLIENGPLEATELAERAFILAPSLTRMLRALEKEKLISRKKDAHDGRRSIIKISLQGEKFIQKVSPDSLAIYNKIEAQFGAQTIDQLLDLLDEIASFRAHPEKCEAVFGKDMRKTK